MPVEHGTRKSVFAGMVVSSMHQTDRETGAYGAVGTGADTNLVARGPKC